MYSSLLSHPCLHLFFFLPVSHQSARFRLSLFPSSLRLSVSHFSLQGLFMSWLTLVSPPTNLPLTALALIWANYFSSIVNIHYWPPAASQSQVGRGCKMPRGVCIGNKTNPLKALTSILQQVRVAFCRRLILLLKLWGSVGCSSTLPKTYIGGRNWNEMSKTCINSTIFLQNINTLPAYAQISASPFGVQFTEKHLKSCC